MHGVEMERTLSQSFHIPDLFQVRHWGEMAPEELVAELAH